ncbi:hypothetical protein EMCRGX_G004802 [Ephydatia muelleri]
MDSRLCYSEADIVGSNATVGSIGAKLLGATTTTTDTEAPPSHSHVRSECCPGASPVIVQEREEQDHIALDFKAPNPTSGGSQSQCVCHPQPMDSSRSRARNKLLVACVIALIFMVGEVLGGYFANSLAIMTDAAHMLSDFGGFMISLFALWVGSRPPSKNMSFGWHRAEVVGAVISVLIIWVLTGVLVYEAILRIINQDYEIDADIMLITACAGVFVNVFMMGVLGHGHSHGGGGGHGHSHGGGGGHSHGGSNGGHSHTAAGEGHKHGAGGDDHKGGHSGHRHGAGGDDHKGGHSSHCHGAGGDDHKGGDSGHSHGAGGDEHHREGGSSGHSREVGSDEHKCASGGNGGACSCKEDHKSGGGRFVSLKKKVHVENINVQAAFIHVIGDLIQSVGVVIAGYIIKFKPEWKVADPICTFVFCILVLFSTINILRDALLVLMEATPRHIDYEGVLKDLSGIDGVQHAHSLHIWSLTTNKITLSAHLVLDEDALGQEVLNLASSMLRKKYGIDQSALQVEEYQPTMDDCRTCIGTV